MRHISEETNFQQNLTFFFNKIEEVADTVHRCGIFTTQ
jgi:hypothetical protein